MIGTGIGSAVSLIAVKMWCENHKYKADGVVNESTTEDKRLTKIIERSKQTFRDDLLNRHKAVLVMVIKFDDPKSAISALKQLHAEYVYVSGKIKTPLKEKSDYLVIDTIQCVWISKSRQWLESNLSTGLCKEKVSVSLLVDVLTYFENPLEGAAEVYSFPNPNFVLDYQQ